MNTTRKQAYLLLIEKRLYECKHLLSKLADELYNERKIDTPEVLGLDKLHDNASNIVDELSDVLDRPSLTELRNWPTRTEIEKEARHIEDEDEALCL